MFDGVIGGITVFIYETGNYSVRGNTLTLNSKRKLYRRNGVEDWSSPAETRSFQFGFAADDLILQPTGGGSDWRLRRDR